MAVQSWFSAAVIPNRLIAWERVTTSGTPTRSMVSLNGPRPAVPANLPFMGVTTDRKAATAAESSSLSGSKLANGHTLKNSLFRRVYQIVHSVLIQFQERTCGITEYMEL